MKWVLKSIYNFFSIFSRGFYKIIVMPYSIVEGNPARVIKMRFGENEASADCNL